MSQRRALVSVSDKTGLVPFVQGLVVAGFEILSTGGTRRHLEEAGINVIDVSAYTGFPEIMNGRVKSLHPKIHGAILGRPDLESDAVAIAEHEIVPFQLVVCNLYPFEQTVAREGVSVSEAIEQIDIGGPSMIRSAAKNHAYVGVVTRADQYENVLQSIEADAFDVDARRKLAAAAFEMTARYDRAIANYMAKVTSDSADAEAADDDNFPAELSLGFQKQQTLRYGENPHQAAAFYRETEPGISSVAAAEKLNGKELSYNNILDLDAAWAIVKEFPGPAASVIKHNNPCGCGTADSLADAFHKAYEGDPISAFGSIIGLNRTVDVATAEQLCEPNRFVEAIIAPDYEPAAFEILTTRPKWKKNVRIMKCPMPAAAASVELDYRRVSGGLLVQQRDQFADVHDDWNVVTERQPTAEELADLKFAWLVCKHVKSNAIVFAKSGQIVGVGAGQMSRLDSAFIAAYKAGERSSGGVVASDAFFPFRDGIDEAAKAGITAVIEPGGSRKDDEVIAACNEHNMAMLFTGRRHFRH